MTALLTIVDLALDFEVSGQLGVEGAEGEVKVRVLSWSEQPQHIPSQIQDTSSTKPVLES